jgi:hypothetical protein
MWPFKRKLKKGDLVIGVKPIHGEVAVGIPGEVFELSDVYENRGTVDNGYTTIVHVPISLLRKAKRKECAKYLEKRAEQN